MAITLVQWVILIMIIGGVIGIAAVIIREAGIVVPAFLIRIGWIVLAVVVGVLAIKFLVGYL